MDRDEAHPAKRTKSRLSVLGVCLTAMTILYVLSSGPARWFSSEPPFRLENWSGDNVLGCCIDPSDPDDIYPNRRDEILLEAYRPLAFLAKQPVFGTPLKSYWDFCEKLRPSIFLRPEERNIERSLGIVD